MMIRIVLTVGSILTIAGSAVAAPYWVAYEGDDFPENVGWTRNVGGNNPNQLGDYREIVDGQYLLLDSRHPDWEGGGDNYSFARPGSFDPGPGEYFLAEWRAFSDATVDQVGHTDTNVIIFSDESYLVAIGLASDQVINSNPFDENAAQVYYISSDVMHEYTFISQDMRAYELYIDAQFAFSGSFTADGPWQSSFNFGDSTGLLSQSHWDYVRFGVAPEPGTLVLLLMAWAGARPGWTRKVRFIC